MTGYTASRNMNIIDKMPLGNNKFLLVMEICNKNYLVSVTDSSINIIKELDKREIKFNENSSKCDDIFKNIFFKKINQKVSSKFMKGKIDNED